MLSFNLWAFVLLLVSATAYPQSAGREPELRRYAAVSNELGYRLQRTQTYQKGNQVVSPYGVSTVLSALYLGATGTTKDQLGEVGYRALEQQGVDISRIYQQLRRCLQESSGQSELEEAIALIYPPDSSVAPQYRQILESAYQCLVQQADYFGGGSYQNVDRWLQEQTNGKISQVIGSDDVVSGLVVLNGIYYEGGIQSYSGVGVEQQEFYNEGKRYPQSVLSYQIKSRYPYYQDQQLQAVQLPFQGAEFSLLVLLPRQQGGISQLQQQLSYNTLQSIVRGFQEREVRVSIPQFTLDYSQHLQQDIRQLGITSMFEPVDGLSAFSGPGSSSYVSQVVQRAVVKMGVSRLQRYGYQDQRQCRYLYGQLPQYEAERRYGYGFRQFPYGAGQEYPYRNSVKSQYPAYLKNEIQYQDEQRYRYEPGQQYRYGYGEEYGQRYEYPGEQYGSYQAGQQYGSDQDQYSYEQGYGYQERQRYPYNSGDYGSQSGIEEFSVDRPFLFYVVHNPTGLNLLAGRISEL